MTTTHGKCFDPDPETERNEWLEAATREQLISYCCENDSNGTFADADMMADGKDPLTRSELIAIIQEWDRENATDIEIVLNDPHVSVSGPQAEVDRLLAILKPASADAGKMRS